MAPRRWRMSRPCVSRPPRCSAWRRAVTSPIARAGGYSHPPIAIHDALIGVKLPAVEVPVSNVPAREPFRHHSFIARAAFASLTGFGIDGYRLAILGLAARLGHKPV